MTKVRDLDLKDDLDKNTIYFPQGIIGLEDLKKYVLVTPNENLPFKCLQSIDEDNMAFVVINPYDYILDYNFEIYDDVIDELEITTPNEVLVLCVVVIPSDIKKMTANFAAPILINVRNKKGKQIVLQDSKFQIRTPIFEEFKTLHSQGASKC